MISGFVLWMYPYLLHRTTASRSLMLSYAFYYIINFDFLLVVNGFRTAARLLRLEYPICRCWPMVIGNVFTSISVASDYYGRPSECIHREAGEGLASRYIRFDGVHRAVARSLLPHILHLPQDEQHWQ